MNSDGAEPIIDHPDEGTPIPSMRDEGVNGPITISNEFADVVVRRVSTRNGMRLEIWSPRRGTSVRLDAVALDALSFQDPELITELLRRNPGS